MTNIAILIPSFNCAETIGDTLESLQAQGAALARISAVYLADDCSTDNTIALAKATWKAPTLLRVLKREHNLGQWDNVNRAMMVVRQDADWVLLLHSDDLAKNRWIEVMTEQIHACSENVASICSSWDTLLPDGSVIPGEDEPSRATEIIEGSPKAVRGTLLKGCWWHISGAAIRVEAFEAIGGFAPDMPYSGDWDWSLRCLNQGWSIVYIPGTLILYRQHPKSVSARSFQRNQDIEESLQIISQYRHLLSRKELTSFHVRRVIYVIRRIGRALLQGRVGRSLLMIRSLVSIVRSYVQCLTSEL